RKAKKGKQAPQNTAAEEPMMQAQKRIRCVDEDESTQLTRVISQPQSEKDTNNTNAEALEPSAEPAQQSEGEVSDGIQPEPNTTSNVESRMDIPYTSQTETDVMELDTDANCANMSPEEPPERTPSRISLVTKEISEDGNDRLVETIASVSSD
ncbi:hypothetical protein GGI12_005627, partial [Dipsacomyces acuminosporus]